MPIQTATISQPGAHSSNYSKSRTVIVSACSDCPWPAAHEFRLFPPHPKCMCGWRPLSAVKLDLHVCRPPTNAAIDFTSSMHCFSIQFWFVHRQIGDASVTCKCPPGYKGKKCQLSEESSSEYTHFPIIVLFGKFSIAWETGAKHDSKTLAFDK